MTDYELFRILESEIGKAGSAAAWAKGHDFSRAFLSDVLAGRRNITERLAKALGFEPIREWQRIKEAK